MRAPFWRRTRSLPFGAYYCWTIIRRLSRQASVKLSKQPSSAYTISGQAPGRWLRIFLSLDVNTSFIFELIRSCHSLSESRFEPQTEGWSVFICFSDSRTYQGKFSEIEKNLPFSAQNRERVCAKNRLVLECQINRERNSAWRFILQKLGERGSDDLRCAS